MILIDAANVSGGGAVLLQYLVDQLTQRQIDFFVLRKREGMLRVAPDQVADGDASLYGRGSELRTYLQRLKPHTLLCFGNFPPPFRANVRTITYYHNPHYVRNHDKRAFTWEHQASRYMRRLYLHLFRQNSDEFVVQIPFIAEAFMETFGQKSKPPLVIPFYDEDRIWSVRDELVTAATPKVADAFLYASSSEPHKNHVNLLRCWELLLAEDIRPLLYLTISPTSSYTTPALLNQLAAVQQAGANVVNLGTLPYADLLRHTAQSSFCIFPSLNETLGLGLVEAYWMGNRILIGQRPYVNQVVKPSARFDPLDPLAMAQVVKQALHKPLPMPQLVIKNQIDDFIRLLQG
jgi:glycosyltransferase involved in cell wall biosynthesis